MKNFQAELEAELEELEQEELEKQLLDVTPATKDQLPSVPAAEPAASSKYRLDSLQCHVKNVVLCNF